MAVRHCASHFKALFTGVKWLGRCNVTCEMRAIELGRPWRSWQRAGLHAERVGSNLGVKLFFVRFFFTFYEKFFSVNVLIVPHVELVNFTARVFFLLCGASFLRCNHIVWLLAIKCSSKSYKSGNFPNDSFVSQCEQVEVYHLSYKTLLLSLV